MAGDNEMKARKSPKSLLSTVGTIIFTNSIHHKDVGADVGVAKTIRHSKRAHCPHKMRIAREQHYKDLDQLEQLARASRIKPEISFGQPKTLSRAGGVVDGISAVKDYRVTSKQKTYENKPKVLRNMSTIAKLVHDVSAPTYSYINYPRGKMRMMRPPRNPITEGNREKSLTPGRRLRDPILEGETGIPRRSKRHLEPSYPEEKQANSYRFQKRMNHDNVVSHYAHRRNPILDYKAGSAPEHQRGRAPAYDWASMQSRNVNKMPVGML